LIFRDAVNVGHGDLSFGYFDDLLRLFCARKILAPARSFTPNKAAQCASPWRWMYAGRDMALELHNPCNFASGKLQHTLNAIPAFSHYPLRMSTKEETGRRLKAARKAKGLRLEDLAGHYPEMSISRVSNWEQGRNMIGVDEAKKLAQLYGVSAAYLLTIEDKPAEPVELELIDHFRKADPRGRAQILRVAQSEAEYIIDGPGSD
jgi:transcriptional regulator with XRE-family HTH domain